mgnify:CR=1 FL=1
MAWIECGQDFIEGDVIRWTEDVTQPSPWGRRGGRITVGQRLIVAQVETDPRNLAGEVELRVVASDGKFAMKQEETFVRRRRALGYQDVSRLAWSDEEARDSVMASTPPVHEGPPIYSDSEGSGDVAATPGRGGQGRTGTGKRIGRPIWQRRVRPPRHAPRF